MMVKLAIALTSEKGLVLRFGGQERSMLVSGRMIDSMEEDDLFMKMASGMKEISSMIELLVKEKFTTMIVRFTKEILKTTNLMEEGKRLMQTTLLLLASSLKD